MVSRVFWMVARWLATGPSLFMFFFLGNYELCLPMEKRD